MGIKSKIRNQHFVCSDANIDEAMSHNETDTQQSRGARVNTPKLNKEIMTKKMLFREGARA